VIPALDGRDDYGGSAFLLSLDLRWDDCRVHNFGGPLSLISEQ
jgi:hypothetical protein